MSEFAMHSAYQHCQGLLQCLPGQPQLHREVSRGEGERGGRKGEGERGGGKREGESGRKGEGEGGGGRGRRGRGEREREK